jgi:hypothetical protein
MADAHRNPGQIPALSQDLRPRRLLRFDYDGRNPAAADRSGGSMRHVLIAILVVGIGPSLALAQHHQPASSQTQGTSEFVEIVRESTRRFQDPSVAIAEEYLPQFGCVSGSHEGAMGIHFVNGAMVADPALDVTRPELLIYEPLPNGRLRLIAVDYLVTTEGWKANNPPNAGPPELMGQLFHLFEFPNRFGLPEFYTLHVWAWKENPQGTFANWNPNVSCDAYTGQY